MENDWQHKPLPTLPQSTPGLGLGISIKMTGAIENIPRQRTTSSSTAGELIRRVSNIFSSRKKRPPALKLSRGGVSKIYESRNSSMQTLSESDEEEDDIRRPSGLGSAASISSLPPSPFSPSHPKDEPELAGPSYMPFGYVHGRATSTPNLLRSLSLRSRGSKRKGRPRNNSRISSGDGHDGNSSVQSYSYSFMRSTSSLQTHNQHQSQYQPQPTIINISSISVETIALILSHLSKSEVAQVAHTCRLFAEASRSALYTHIDLNEFTPVQLEKLVALLASRRDFTDLVRTFSCSTWPRFFLPTSPIASPSSLSPSPILSRGVSPSLHSSTFLSPHDHQPSSDPEMQHHNTLLTATFTLSFQRMSNLTSLTLPTYDHDLLAHHTAFGLQQITFECDMLSKEEVKELFGWLDGQINVKVLAFPRLSWDCDLSLIKAGTTGGETNVAEGPLKSEEGLTKVVRPKTTSGPLRQSSAGPTVGGGTKEEGREKKFMVASFLVPLDSASSPSSSIISTYKTPSLISAEPPKPKRGASPTSRPRPQPLTKLPPRPQSAAASSPIFTTFAEAFANESQALQMQAGASPSPSPSPSSSQIPFPTSSSKPTSTSTACTATTTAATATSVAAMTTSGYPPLSPLGSPTLLPNLTALCGPPSLIISLSTPPLPPTANHVSTSSSPSALSPSGYQRRPLQIISLNITTTLYTGLRPTTIMHRLVGTTNVLKLYFGEHVDKRSVEKVFGAAGSSLGGVRGEKMGEGSGKRSEKKGEEWKGLVKLHVGFVQGRPGSDEAIHKMVSSAIPRYPYLRVLELEYLPQGTLVSHSHSHLPLSTTNSPGHSPLPSPLPSPFIITSTTPTTPTPTSNAMDGAKGGKPNGLLTPPRSVSPSLPTTPPSSNSVISSTMTTPTVSVTPITPLGFSHRQSQFMEKKTKRELSPPEQAYIRQWIKFCADLERVVFLSGAEWVRSARGK